MSGILRAIHMLQAMQIRASIFVLFVILAAGCTRSVEPELVASMRLEPEELLINLDEGAQAALTPVFIDQTGRPVEVPAADYQIIWTSSEEGVVAVEEGLVTPLMAGETTVFAESRGLAPATAFVIVEQMQSGSVSFEYTGHEAGSFSMSAEWPYRGDPRQFYDSREFFLANPAYGVAYFMPSADMYVIYASKKRPDGWYDVLGLSIPSGRITGQASFEFENLAPFGRGGELAIGTGGGGPLAYYFIDRLSVTITTITDDRLAGTFEATLINIREGPDAEIMNGVFDLPLVRDSPW